MSTTFYVCNKCFGSYAVHTRDEVPRRFGYNPNNTEPCLCGNVEFITFIDLVDWNFQSHRFGKKLVPIDEYIKRMKILSKFTEEDLEEIKCHNLKTNLERSSS